MRLTVERLRKDAGFSLVELLIVISILGVLAGIAVFSFDPFSDAADTAATDANDQLCLTAQESWQAGIQPEGATTPADLLTDFDGTCPIPE